MAIKKQITFEGLKYNLDDRDRVAADATLQSGGTFSLDTRLQYNNIVSGSDVATAMSVATHGGRTTFVPNVTADRIYTLPQVAEGLNIHMVGAGALAADGHDLSVVTETAGEEFYHGAIIHHDTDQTAQTTSTVWCNGTSEDTIKLDLVEAFDLHFVGRSTTVWYVYGWTAGATVVTCA